VLGRAPAPRTVRRRAMRAADARAWRMAMEQRASVARMKAALTGT